VKPKPILIIIDEDYEPSTKGATAFDDVVASLEFHEIGAAIGEVDYLPEEALKLCQEAIATLISAPGTHTKAGDGYTKEEAIRATLDILCNLQMCLECMPVKPIEGR